MIPTVIPKTITEIILLKLKINPIVYTDINPNEQPISINILSENEPSNGKYTTIIAANEAVIPNFRLFDNNPINIGTAIAKLANKGKSFVAFIFFNFKISLKIFLPPYSTVLSFVKAHKIKQSKFLFRNSSTLLFFLQLYMEHQLPQLQKEYL